MEPVNVLVVSLVFAAMIFWTIRNTISRSGALFAQLRCPIQFPRIGYKIWPVVPNPMAPLGTFRAEDANRSNLYALVIGIDDYVHQSSLAGAVADANSILDFLTIDLGVPSSHISALQNSEATRSAIITAFQRLQNDARICHGDPILIYFAGHGGVGNESYEGREHNWPTSKIQVIFPFDYGMDDGSEGKINCITDKAIATLLNNIAAAKGDNITVIFDSCHSASASRAHSPSVRRARNAPVKFPIPADLDNQIIPSVAQSLLGSRHTSLPLYTHQTSHVHLAACGSDEQAWEENGRGVFTAALLKTIRTYGASASPMQNYLGIYPACSQTPHCYGALKSRTLFDGRVSSRKLAYIPALYNVKAQSVTLQAGTSSGVTKGSIWEVRENPMEGEQPILAKMKAGKPGVSNTTLIPEEDMWNEAFRARCKDERAMGENGRLYARLIKSGPGNELKVWFSPEVDRILFSGPKFDARDVRMQEHEVGYVAQKSMADSDITVTSYHPPVESKRRWLCHVLGISRRTWPEPEAEFHLSNPTAKRLGISTLQQHKRIRRDQIESVLFAAARWNMYLNYHNTASTQSPISVEMFKIGERIKCDEEYSNDWKLVPSEEQANLIEMGVVDLEVHSRDLYAARLRSSLYEPLYVRMFYFDTATFSIDDLFGHSTSNGKADPVVPSYGDFVIGDGRKGGMPLSFELNPGQKSDLGYLKIFWSTDPLELDHLGQGPAFETINTGARGFVKKKTGARQTSTWGVEVLTMIQRAPSAPKV